MKIVALTPEQVQEIVDPPEYVPPKEQILRKLEQEWLDANKEGRTDDMEAFDEQHAAVLKAETDEEANEEFERVRGVPFISQPSPKPPDRHVPDGHPPTTRLDAELPNPDLRVTREKGVHPK